MRISSDKLPFWYRWLPELKRVKAVRGYEVDGEASDFDKKHRSPITIIATLFTFIFVFLFLMYVIGLSEAWLKSDIIKQWIHTLEHPQKTITFNYWDPHYFLVSFHHPILLTLIMIIDSIMTTIVYKKFSVRFDTLVKGGGQKGDGRLATIEEIKAQYPSIPDSKERYEGIGGLPVCHYRNQYFIETATTNSLIIGTSRSGKGEMIVVPMIDILARASEQSSMVINDPKGELYASSKDTLEKYGYEVQILNIAEPLKGMSYNPLQIIKEAYLDGELDRAEDLANSFSHMMFDDPEAGQNAWINKGAESMCTGLILGLLYKCDKENDFEKFNLYNVGQMLIELGDIDGDDDDKKKKSDLDLYFDSLPAGSKAKAQYASINLTGGNGKSIITSSVVEKFRLYQMGYISKMSSKNSFELKSLGFPKYVTIHFEPKLELYKTRIKLEFLSKEWNKEEEVFDEVELMSDYVKPNLEGVATLNFDCTLKKGHLLRLSTEDFQITYMLEIQKDHKEVLLKPVGNEKYRWKGIKDIQMMYSEKPIAVFMVTPDYDTSKNSIATTFVDQVYNTLMKNASSTRGKKCHRRVHFLLDEFGNMPALSNLDNKLTVCLSRNVLFDLMLQSYEQLNSVYGQGVGKIAKENCQNKVLIKTDDMDTIKDFSQNVGKRTVESVSRDRKVSDLSSAGHISVGDLDVLPPERISDMLEGEMLVIRKLHRQDNQRRKIRAYPIFDTGETSMPFRYQFLSSEYDMSKDIIDLDVRSDHLDLDIKTVSMDFKAWRKEIHQDTNHADVSDLKGGIDTSNDERDDASFKRTIIERYPELNDNGQVLFDNLFRLIDDENVDEDDIENQLNSENLNLSLIKDLMDYVRKYKKKGD